MPKMMPLCICATMVSGLTATPQSTAHDDAVDVHLAIVGDGHLGDLRRCRCRTRTAARCRAPCAARAACPSRTLPRRVRGHASARGFLPSRSRRILERILLRRRGQLVDEALDHEGVARRADAAPERGRNAGRLLAHVVDVEVRDLVRQLDGAVDRVGIDAVLEQRREEARHDRRADDAMVPGDELAVRIKSGADAVVVVGPVHVVLDVLLAAPDDLHRILRLLGDERRLQR